MARVRVGRTASVACNSLCFVDESDRGEVDGVFVVGELTR